MSKSNLTENDVLKLILTGVDPAWRAGASVWVALYTATPGEAGSANTNETTYASYARVLVPKSTGWTDGGSTFSNAIVLEFPQCTANPPETITHAAIVSTASGPGQIFYYGELNDALLVGNLIQPRFPINGIQITED